VHSWFPDPADAPADGPLAYGGDLEPATLVDAYAHGIFPWPDQRGRLSWWSPDPRAVFPAGGVHVSRTLGRTLRSGRFACTVDAAFAEVVRGCADRPDEGSWITPAMARAYGRLHELGLAHSVEVWDGERLVGGIYGVALGGAFVGESMFHRVPDASKVALVTLDRELEAAGYAFLDAQLPTAHLLRMGVAVIPRSDYLALLRRALALRPVGLDDDGRTRRFLPS
jgi:leucyl/phenylalanyl-tRNA---protein transferase